MLFSAEKHGNPCFLSKHPIKVWVKRSLRIYEELLTNVIYVILYNNILCLMQTQPKFGVVEPFFGVKSIKLINRGTF